MQFLVFIDNINYWNQKKDCHNFYWKMEVRQPFLCLPERKVKQLSGIVNHTNLKNVHVYGMAEFWNHVIKATLRRHLDA